MSNNNLSVVPKGLPRNLVLLHLEKNSIRSIPGDALTSVRNLEYLLLHNNKLRSRSIHPAAFQVPPSVSGFASGQGCSIRRSPSYRSIAKVEIVDRTTLQK